MRTSTLLIGGYDEALKGAVILQAAKSIAAHSPWSSLLVIRDHYEGIEGIDDLRLDANVEFLTGGCFCCSMKHDFKRLLVERAEKGRIHYLIVEVPLTAELMIVKDTIRDVVGDSTLVTTAFAIDPAIAGIMIETFPELMSRSLRSSDVLAIRRGLESEIEKSDMLGQEWEFSTGSKVGGLGFDDECDISLFSRRALR